MNTNEHTKTLILDQSHVGENSTEEALELKVQKQEIPNKVGAKSRTIETRKRETQLNVEKEREIEREAEFYRLKNLQAKLTHKRGESEGKQSSEEEPNEFQFYTNWEKQVNGRRRTEPAEQKKMLAALLKENHEPENILQKSLNINKESKSLMKKNLHPKFDSERVDEPGNDFGETAEMLQFCEQRIEKYSREKEELWAKLNEALGKLRNAEEQLSESRRRENRVRAQKAELEDQVANLQVKVGKEVQQTQEMRAEADEKEKEIGQLRRKTLDEKTELEKQKKELAKVVQEINREKEEIERNAEKINERNAELQGYIDNQEVSLGKAF